jgi:hypothetical protein
MFGRQVFPDQIDTSIGGRKLEAAEKSTLIFPIGRAVPFIPGGHVTTRHLGVMRSERIDGDAGLGALEYARMERLSSEASQRRSTRSRPQKLRR